MQARDFVGGIAALAVGAFAMYGFKSISAELDGTGGSSWSFGSLFSAPSRPSSAAVEDIVQIEAERINKRKGSRIGWFGSTRFDGAEARGRVLLVTMRVPGERHSFVAKSGMATRRRTAENFCGDAYIVDMLKRGGIIDVAYRNDNGATFFSTRFDHTACA